MTAARADATPSPAYTWYVVGELTLAYILSFIDRQIITLMVGPIKQDLGLNVIFGASSFLYIFAGLILLLGYWFSVKRDMDRSDAFEAQLAAVPDSAATRA